MYFIFIQFPGIPVSYILVCQGQGLIYFIFILPHIIQVSYILVIFHLYIASCHPSFLHFGLYVIQVSYILVCQGAPRHPEELDQGGDNGESHSNHQNQESTGNIVDLFFSFLALVFFPSRFGIVPHFHQMNLKTQKQKFMFNV